MPLASLPLKIDFRVIHNTVKKHNYSNMKDLSDQVASELKAGASQCAYNIAVSASVGGLFGGIGAAVGAVAAATGPSCLGWW